MFTKKIHFILLLLTLGLFSTLAAAEAVEFKAYAQSPVVSGQQLRVTFTVNADGKDLRAPDFPGFDVLMGPSRSVSSSTQIINGSMSSETSVTFTYVLMTQKEGTYNIAPATVTVKGRQYASNALSIKVLPADKAGATSGTTQQSGSTGAASDASVSAENLFMRAIVSRTKLYEQDFLTVSYKLYSRVDLSNVENVKLPDFEGFLVQEIEQPESSRGQLSMENYNGVNYQTLLLKQAVLYPQHTGVIKIPSASIDAIFRVRNQTKGSRTIFDDFFDSYQSAKKTLRTPELTINVESLPTAGKPVGFSGAVGEYSLKTSASTTKVKQNEAITLKVTLTGTGNLKLAKTPDFQIPTDFEQYDPKTDLKINTTAAGVSGSKSVEYLVIPRHEGEYLIPGLNFSYFDTKSKSYKTIQTEPLPISVERGTGAPSAATSGAIANFSDKESVKLLGQDIRFIRPEFTLVKRGVYLFGSLSYCFWYIFPTLLLAFFFVVYRKRMAENANVALMKGRKASKVAGKRLKQAHLHLTKNESHAYYDELLKALWGYLSDKLTMPLSTLNKESVATALHEKGVDEATRSLVLEILNSCEFARYAPDQGHEAMEKLYTEALAAIDQIESLIKK